MSLIFSELCIVHHIYIKAHAVAFCLKYNASLGSPGQNIFVLTSFSDSSPRRPGPITTLLKQNWPCGATSRPAKMYSARLLMHFRAGLNY